MLEFKIIVLSNMWLVVDYDKLLAPRMKGCGIAAEAVDDC